MALPNIVPVAKPRPTVPEVLPIRTDRNGDAISNLLLLSAPDEEFNLIRPLLEPVELSRYDVLYQQGNKIEHACFINHGMVSLVVVANDGRSVEVGISGRDGLVGLPVVFGLKEAAVRAIVQLPGDGLRLSAHALAGALAVCPQLRERIQRYAFAQHMEVAQLAACNRLHDIEQRLARWLLMCQDTVDSSKLPLTHEFIAQMLGTGRPTVTIAAGSLERAGIIENTRGSVNILDRKRLEDVACECYAAVQNFAASQAVL